VHHFSDLSILKIVKHEWPRLWPTFITDIVGSSRNSQSLCMNNMAVLRLLSEEVFDFGTGLTSARATQLKMQFCGQFESVFQLCHEILVSTAMISFYAILVIFLCYRRIPTTLS
jgi:exportin-1